jgi:hypothetical protein
MVAAGASSHDVGSSETPRDGREILALRRQSERFARVGDSGATAEAVNRRLIEIAPSRTVAYTRLARCLKERGDFAAAEALYRRVVEMEPNNVIANNNLKQLRTEREAPTRDQSIPLVRRDIASGRTAKVASDPTQPSPGDDGLSFLHQRLKTHFALLRQSRNKFAPGTPIFALEHGLSETELAVLSSEVRSAVRRGHLPHESWLPFVVYATEVGYEYSGDEYWQTFEARTPGWVDGGDRHYIRQKFIEFKDRFGGAEPTGPWAAQFSIICWPITQAVLPTDLQVHLARLLFEYRRVYTSELLADPAQLGRRLAAQAWHASSRFRNFAQNTSLLGQVAAALLVGNDGDSRFLLDSTLKRIVADLSQEREAKRWLLDAKSSAARVQIHGFRPTERTSTERSSSGGAVRLPSATDPAFSLTKDGAAWTAYIEIPDLSGLAERLPNVHEEVARLRVLIAGVAGPPLASGQLLYPGKQLRLTEWPRVGSRLIQLENGSEAVNSLLSDQCVLSPGPLWLFRVGDVGRAVEVRGKFVRPGHDYVLLAENPLPAGRPSWVAETVCTTSRTHAYTLEVPSALGMVELAALRTIGLAVVTEVDVRPAGFVPALWDGEGSAEWIAGENPIVAVSSSRKISRSFFTLDGEPLAVPWPTSEDEIFVRLAHLGVGTHVLHVALFPEKVDQPAAQGALDLIIRPPLTTPTIGSFREGLMVLATPVNPTLGELWDGKATLEVRGPRGVQASLELSLADRSNKVLARRRLVANLPIESTQWQSLLTAEFRKVPQIQRMYEAAESCLITVSHPNLGAVSLRSDREFAPLRCAVASDRDGPFVRLVDNTDADEIQIDAYDFARPDQPIALRVDPKSVIRRPLGGLITVRAGTLRAAVILPPHIKDWVDLRNQNVTPEVSVGVQSAEEVCRLIALADLWRSASLPANPVGENRGMAVLRAITGALCGLLGGNRWSRLEQQLLRGASQPSISDLRDAVGENQGYRALTSDLDRRFDEMRLQPPEAWAEVFAGVLNAHARGAGLLHVETWLAEYLLRLASDPGSLAAWPPNEVQAAAQAPLGSPVLLRSARYVVLRIAFGDTSSRYGAWVWR